mmetsp:Transcript_10838/g.26279  ORF Transcript_10838/g.26279 Transcript_10838/m.26279 type:complete len:253 (-) Transcript_10838:234-992(-)
MPKSARTCVFFPRRKEGEDAEPGPLTRRVHVNYETLEGLFHLPLKDAARELGLCPTTFKKACRALSIGEWRPKGQSRTPLARREAQPDDVNAAITSLHVAATVPGTSPVRHDGSIASMDASAFCFSFAANASSSSTARASPDPFGAAFSSAAPEGQFHAVFQHKTVAPLDALSYIDSLPTTEPCGGEQGGATPLKAGPPRERSCVEAVMEYLDGPLAENFDFMFADEAGSAAGAPPPHVGAWLDGVDNGAEC